MGRREWVRKEGEERIGPEGRGVGGPDKRDERES